MLWTILAVVAGIIATAGLTFWSCKDFWRHQGTLMALNVLRDMGAVDERVEAAMRQVVHLRQRGRRPAQRTRVAA